MTFQDALTAIQAGHRVRRAKWTVVKYMFLDQGDFLGWTESRQALAIRGIDKPVFLAITLRTVDILATDWELVP